ncbi:MAG: FAD binding domain-containing protein [Chloroflexota bacterium]|nr:FAD binding domain-containing protein [Chloroflexota bacterium]
MKKQQNSRNCFVCGVENEFGLHLELDAVKVGVRTLSIGANVRLQDLLKVTQILPALSQAIRHEETCNPRQMLSVADTIVAADGRSPFATAMLALDTRLILMHESAAEQVYLGDFLPLRSEWSQYLIAQVTIPSNVKMAYHYIDRSPADLPIVCAAAVQWHSGRTRIALGGYGHSPLMAMDGRKSDGAEIAARDAYSEAGDQSASAEYRADAAATMTRRCLQEIGGISAEI